MKKYSLEYKCRRCGNINIASLDDTISPNEVMDLVDQALDRPVQFVCPKCNKPTYQDIVSVELHK